MKVSDMMSKQVRTCQTDTPLQECARTMADLNVGAIPVCQGDKVVGMLTDRDIVLRAVAAGHDIRTAKAGDCMTKPVITCSPDTDAHQAADTMASKQIRRLPVVQGDQLVGICSLGDMATVNIHVNEAGDALSSISRPSQPGAH